MTDKNPLLTDIRKNNANIAFYKKQQPFNCFNIVNEYITR